MKKIGLIGAGGIGRPIAMRLAKLGFAVTVCDIQESTLLELAAEGMKTTTVPSGCAMCDVILVLVASDSQVNTVVLGQNGLADSIDPANAPAILIMSTVLPETVIALGHALEGKVSALCDTPVSGGIRGAIDGTLTILAGGSEADVKHVDAFLQHLSSRIFHCGPLGAGSTAKILNNMMSNATIYLMTEVLTLANGIGVNTEWLTELMDASAGTNWMTANFERTKEFYRLNTASMQALSASVNITRKDLALGLTLAANAGISCPTFESLVRGANALSYENVMSTWTPLAS